MFNVIVHFHLIPMIKLSKMDHHLLQINYGDGKWSILKETFSNLEEVS